MNLKKRSIVLLIACLAGAFSLSAQSVVEQWGRFEATLKGTRTGNPFLDTRLKATFTNGDTRVTVTGFYDGRSEYKIRFMPEKTGTWTYTTRSNMKALDAQTGTFTCVAAKSDNHGPVRVHNTYDFAYADGKPYYPFGTTMYAFVHPDSLREEQTLKTLASAPFNKIRICLFPKTYDYNNDEPRYYPFQKIEGVPLESDSVAVWDFSRFDTGFFRHLERRIDDLDRLGIECDLILFHPYDAGYFGFDRMSREADLHYVKYVVARLASFKNVWWSLANEYDFLRGKTMEDWIAVLETVAENDPSNHLLSCHNGKIYFENHHPLITHLSIQNEWVGRDFGRVSLIKDSYRKPLVLDEICYEGNFPARWGSLTGEELTSRFWQCCLVGAYATHGETFTNDDHIAWTEKGAILRGTSPARIAFLRRLIERTGPFRVIDNWNYMDTAVSESGQYLVYLGNAAPEEWEFSVPNRSRIPDGTRVKVEVIDTWNMTVTPAEGPFITKAKQYVIGTENNKKVKLPGRPYMALLLTVEK
ncbi:MAG: DUF5060 domain-containing protein [Rikenellaceae bacterium]|jgi:hypothetical protein|nr:DUF5060 domain-containing protein [Rikenellaceae bacterium]